MPTASSFWLTLSCPEAGCGFWERRTMSSAKCRFSRSENRVGLNASWCVCGRLCVHYTQSIAIRKRIGNIIASLQWVFRSVFRSLLETSPSEKCSEGHYIRTSSRLDWWSWRSSVEFRRSFCDIHISVHTINGREAGVETRCVVVSQWHMASSCAWIHLRARRF